MNPDPIMLSPVATKRLSSAVHILLIILALAGGAFMIGQHPYAKIVLMDLAPIEFYGKVVDQNGVPIEGANIEISVSHFLSMGRKRDVIRRTSDASGLFSIKGLRGLSIYVKASKLGCYRVYNGVAKPADPASERSYGGHNPDRKNPELLVLYKPAHLEPLVHSSKEAWRISNDGTPRLIPLDPKQPNGPHHIRIECWIDMTKKNLQGQHSWKMRMSVPDGGLALRSGRYDFQAPDDGYTSFVEYDSPPASVSQIWRRGVVASYFLCFSDGVFGRINFDFDGDEEPFCSIESHLNPQIGSRNLTADPDKH